MTTRQGPAERSFIVRPGVAADVPVLARHRVGMMVDIGPLVPGGPAARRIELESRRFIDDQMGRGEWLAWIAEDRGAVLGSGSAMLRPLPPGVRCEEGGIEVYLLSFYTEPHARRRGVATAVMQAAQAQCRAHDIPRASLFASAAGRGVYEPLGFVGRADAMEWHPREGEPG